MLRGGQRAGSNYLPLQPLHAEGVATSFLLLSLQSPWLFLFSSPGDLELCSSES